MPRHARVALGMLGLLPLVLGCGEPEAPALQSVSPGAAAARGGVLLTLAGSGFAAGAKVWLGAAAASDVQVLSGAAASARTPPLLAGRYDVTLSNPHGASAVLSGGFLALPLDLHFVEATDAAFPELGEGAVTSLAAGDLDLDGDVDLVLGRTGAATRILFGDGAGNFADASAEDAEKRLPGWTEDTRLVLAADFNGDGALDLYGARAGAAGGGGSGGDAGAEGGAGGGGGGAEPPSGSGSADALYLNDGFGHFEDVSATAWPRELPETLAAAAGDLDGDGQPDLVLATGSAEQPIVVLLNDAKAAGAHAVSFEEAELGEGLGAGLGSVPGALALADPDGDGCLDVLVATPDGSARLRLLRGDCAGGFDLAPPGALPALPEPVTRIAAGDVDGDGNVDLVLVCPGQDRLLAGDGAGHFFDDTVAAMPFDLVPGAAAELADLDRDGRPDLAIANAGARTRLYVNDGAGRFVDRSPALPAHAEPSAALSVLDADGDADADIVVAGTPGPQLRLYLSVEPSPFEEP